MDVDAILRYRFCAFVSSVCGNVVLVINNFDVPEMGDLPSRTSAGHLVEFDVSWAYPAFGALCIASIALYNAEECVLVIIGVFLGCVPVTVDIVLQ